MVIVYFQQRPNRELDVYEEVLKWQRENQERSVEETQNILNINLEQILKVSGRRRRRKSNKIEDRF